jgi:hypothetical protein
MSFFAWKDSIYSGAAIRLGELHIGLLSQEIPVKIEMSGFYICNNWFIFG